MYELYSRNASQIESNQTNIEENIARGEKEKCDEFFVPVIVRTFFERSRAYKFPT